MLHRLLLYKISPSSVRAKNIHGTRNIHPKRWTNIIKVWYRISSLQVLCPTTGITRSTWMIDVCVIGRDAHLLVLCPTIIEQYFETGWQYRNISWCSIIFQNVLWKFIVESTGGDSHTGWKLLCYEELVAKQAAKDCLIMPNQKVWFHQAPLIFVTKQEFTDNSCPKIGIHNYKL